MFLNKEICSIPEVAQCTCTFWHPGVHHQRPLIDQITHTFTVVTANHGVGHPLGAIAGQVFCLKTQQQTRKEQDLKR